MCLFLHMTAYFDTPRFRMTPTFSNFMLYSYIFGCRLNNMLKTKLKLDLEICFVWSLAKH